MARYLIESKTLIQHIPRTGGTWIEKALETLEIDFGRWLGIQHPWLPMKHALWAHYQGHRHTPLIQYQAAFVRHPIRYYESIWRYLRRLRKYPREQLLERWPWHPKRRAVELYSPDFNIWAARMLDQEPSWVTRLFESYVGPRGGEFCCFIGRTEQLVADFCDLMILLGYEDQVRVQADDLRQLGDVNRSRPMPIEWSPSLRQDVLQQEAPIISRFYADQSRLFGAFVHDERLAQILVERKGLDYCRTRAFEKALF